MGKILALQVATDHHHYETLNLQDHVEALSSANHVKTFGSKSCPSQVPTEMTLSCRCLGCSEAWIPDPQKGQDHEQPWLHSAVTISQATQKKTRNTEVTKCVTLSYWVGDHLLCSHRKGCSWALFLPLLCASSLSLSFSFAPSLNLNHLSLNLTALPFGFHYPLCSLTIPNMETPHWLCLSAPANLQIKSHLSNHAQNDGEKTRRLYQVLEYLSVLLLPKAVQTVIVPHWPSVFSSGLCKWLLWCHGALRFCVSHHHP